MFWDGGVHVAIVMVWERVTYLAIIIVSGRGPLSSHKIVCDGYPFLAIIIVYYRGRA